MYLKVECFFLYVFCTGLSKEYALSDVSFILLLLLKSLFFFLLFDQWEWRNYLDCEAKKKMLFVLSEAKWIGFRTTVLFKALFTLLIYYNTPFTTEGYWCFFCFCFFFLVLCNFCQYILVKKKSFCIFLCYVAKARRIYLDVSLTKCLYPFLFLCWIFIENENQVHEGFFIYLTSIFGLIIILKCYIWSHAKLALTEGVCPLQNHPRRLCTRPERMIIRSTECHWGVGNVNLHYTSCQQKKKEMFPTIKQTPKTSPNVRLVIKL